MVASSVRFAGCRLVGEGGQRLRPVTIRTADAVVRMVPISAEVASSHKSSGLGCGALFGLQSDGGEIAACESEHQRRLSGGEEEFPALFATPRQDDVRYMLERHRRADQRHGVAIGMFLPL